MIRKVLAYYWNAVAKRIERYEFYTNPIQKAHEKYLADTKNKIFKLPKSVDRDEKKK